MEDCGGKGGGFDWGGALFGDLKKEPFGIAIVYLTIEGNEK
jgi:hypothetical protein